MNINGLNWNGNNLDSLNTGKNENMPKSGDIDFFGLLTNAVNQVNGESMNNISVPSSWGSNSFGTDAIDNAVSFLKENYGLNVADRTPTYEVTAEQKEWLSSRHDLDNAKNLQPYSREEQELLADLTYLGIVSPESAKRLHMVSLPFSESLGSALSDNEMPDLVPDSDQYNDLDFFEKIDNTISSNQKWFDFISGKLSGENLDIGTKTDFQNYIDKMSSFISGKQGILNVLEGLI